MNLGGGGRFKMYLGNSINVVSSQDKVQAFRVPTISSVGISGGSGGALNSPMIGRIYFAKPGCSACGKKVS